MSEDQAPYGDEASLKRLEERVAAVERALIKIMGRVQPASGRVAAQMGVPTGVTAGGSQKCGKCGRPIDGTKFMCPREDCPIDPAVSKVEARHD